jgi:DNA-binding NtrC family response regulator
MARPRSNTTQLGKLLDSVPQPIYVLDEELAIVFLNEACREWLGPGVQELTGRPCLYASGPDLTGPDALAAGLCPPPTITEGRPMAARVARHAEQGVTFRQANFTPLLASDRLIGVLAIVGPRDDPEDADRQARGASFQLAAADQAGVQSAAANTASCKLAPREEEEAVALHELIERFRGQMRLRHSIERLIGVSPVMRRARAQAELAAESRASVVLIGPNGSGRQHVAAAIHYGALSGQPGAMVPLACSVLGPDLVRSTVRALVSATIMGKRSAGTLLLNEADSLSAESQFELFPLLAARGFPLRLMATAQQSLVEMARRGRYRDDLAALLSTIAIELPPLAQRREDLPLLAQALVEEANARHGKQITGFTTEALDKLDAYSWPGNLHELAEMVADSHQRAAGREITPDDLPERLRLAADAAARPRRKDETIKLDEFLERIERELLRRAMARAKGNKAKAAQLLGVSRARLGRRLTQLRIVEGGEVDGRK